MTLDQNFQGRVRAPRARLRRRLLLGSLGVVAGAALFVAFAVIPRVAPRAAVATGYMARVACACHFIGGRSLESCAMDKEGGMELVRLSKDEKARRVIARVPLLSTSSATHTPGLGCVLDAKQ